MKLKKWLKQISTAGVHCNIWMDYQKTDGTWDSDLIYAGSMYEIPYWIVDYSLSPVNENGEPIYYAHNIRKNVSDEAGTKGYNGFVICLRERADT